jgi:hypothetical protein
MIDVWKRFLTNLKGERQASAAAWSDVYRLGACPRNGGFWWRRLRESDSACL